MCQKPKKHVSRVCFRLNPQDLSLTRAIPRSTSAKTRTASGKSSWTRATALRWRFWIYIWEVSGAETIFCSRGKKKVQSFKDFEDEFVGIPFLPEAFGEPQQNFIYPKATFIWDFKSFSTFSVDDFCKDSLEIVDVGSRRSLYRGCSEISRPVQVQSFSNNVEVSWMAGA